MNIISKIGIFFLLVFCNSSQGQDYKFDKIVKSSFSTSHFPNQEFTQLFNSEDNSYFLQAFSRNDSILARIFDKDELVVHHFFVKDQVKFDFTFLKTTKLISQDDNYSYSFSEMKNKDGKDEIRFSIRNKQLRRTGNLKLTVRKTDENFFNYFLHGALELASLKEIVPPENFIVLEATGTNDSGSQIEYKLISVNDIDVAIKVVQ